MHEVNVHVHFMYMSTYKAIHKRIVIKWYLSSNQHKVYVVCRLQCSTYT